MMYAIINLDGNYGTVRSRHRTAEAASVAYDRLVDRAPQNAMVWLMYRVVAIEASARKGDRVLATESVRVAE